MEAAEEREAVERVERPSEAGRQQLATEDVERVIVLRTALIAYDAVGVLLVPADAPGGGGGGGLLDISVTMLGGEGCLMFQQTGGDASALRLWRYGEIAAEKTMPLTVRPQEMAA